MPIEHFRLQKLKPVCLRQNASVIGQWPFNSKTRTDGLTIDPWLFYHCTWCRVSFLNKRNCLYNWCNVAIKQFKTNINHVAKITKLKASIKCGARFDTIRMLQLHAYIIEDCSFPFVSILVCSHQCKSNYFSYINSHRKRSLSVCHCYSRNSPNRLNPKFITMKIFNYSIAMKLRPYTYANFRQMLWIQFIVFVRFWVLFADNNLLWPKRKQLVDHRTISLHFACKIPK